MPAPSLAERWRHHRAVFELALELGTTPKDAERELRRRQREARRRCGTLASQNEAQTHPTDHAHERWEAPWMLRE